MLLSSGSTLLAMPMPSAYLTSTKNLAGILDAKVVEDLALAA